MTMLYRDPDLVDDELQELRAEARFERQQRNILMRHPDCRDPDHPGCEQCSDDETEAHDD